MNYRKQIGIYIGVLAVLIVSLYLIAKDGRSGSFLCEKGINSYGFQYTSCLFDPQLPAEILFFLSAATFLSLIPLFFLKEAVYRAWRKFAIIYLPIAIFIIIFGTTSSSGGFGPSMAFTKEIASVWLSALFLIISIGIMVVKTWKLWGKGEETTHQAKGVRKM